jgi:polar amino acid transport system substrate-binding protein
MANVDQRTCELLAPTGSLRVAVAVGSANSAVWTRRDAEAGEPRGPTVDLARHIAERLGVPLTLIECASSGEIIETASSGTWDVSFAPVDAERKKLVDFGPNYFLGESTYMVPAESPITSIEEVDRKGVRVYGIENTATIRSARESLKNTSAIGLQGLDEASKGSAMARWMRSPSERNPSGACSRGFPAHGCWTVISMPPALRWQCRRAIPKHWRSSAA